jgi:Transposase DDE domain/Domain of unknown function (DUF4372)
MDSTQFQRISPRPDWKRHLMQHRNTVLHRLLGHLRWHRFEALVAHHASDKHVRTLTTKTQFIAMAYGQLSGADGLRETVTRFNSQATSLYHLGAKPIARSTMADANANRSSEIFEDLFKDLAAAAQRRVRQAVEEATFLIDSTHLRLNEYSAKWARYSAGVCGAKVHVGYDPDADQPIYAMVSTANVNDITAAKQMPIEAGATYVFDLGYYDYGWWNTMHQAGCRIVTRLKKNTKLTITREKHVPPGGPILADRFGMLPTRQMHNRRNPMNCEMREVVVRIDTGKVIRVLTNDLTSSAQTIADLYKRRWAIELHFRWIKQALKIRKFLGTSGNAVRTQVYIALIVFLLLHLAHEAEKVLLNLLDFVRLVRTHLMSRRDIRALDRPDEPAPPPDQRQYGLDWSQA